MFFSRKHKSQDTGGGGAGRSEEVQVPAGLDAFMSRILLVVDGSRNSLDATRFALNLTLKTGCSILAAFVIDTATMDYLQQMRIFVQDEREDLEKDMERKGERYLERVKAMGEEFGISVDTALVRGRLHQAILRLAKERSADAIVVAGWKNEIQQKDSSSVERQLILDQADCPVIVIKKRRFDSV